MTATWHAIEDLDLYVLLPGHTEVELRHATQLARTGIDKLDLRELPEQKQVELFLQFLPAQKPVQVLYAIHAVAIVHCIAILILSSIAFAIVHIVIGINHNHHFDTIIIIIARR